MIKVVFLDSTPLWLLCLSPNTSNREYTKAINWLQAIKNSGKVVVIPEITDYEVRREFIHYNLSHPGQWAGHLTRLDALIAANEYLEINHAMMRKAAELWGDLRARGLSVAGDKELDGDVILAAQAIISDQGRNEVIVATKNVKHISRMVPADDWWNIT